MSGRRIIGAVEIPTSAIVGTVVHAHGLTGNIPQQSAVVGNLATAYTTNAATYDGDYDVTPTAAGQELKTKQKYMTDDVTVHAIPYFDVGNATGGRTVYIAGQIEIE